MSVTPASNCCILSAADIGMDQEAGAHLSPPRKRQRRASCPQAASTRQGSNQQRFNNIRWVGECEQGSNVWIPRDARGEFIFLAFLFVSVCV